MKGVSTLRLARSLRTVIHTAVVWCALIASSAAQAPKTGPPASPAPAVLDPLGRESPRGTIAGFTQAVHREDFATAAAFMQLSERQRPNAETLARTLTTLIDRYYTRPITSISGSPQGVATDGLPLDRERISIELPNRTADIVLRRITDKQAGPIWLISSDTLNQVPSLGRSLEASWIERNMPEGLVDREFFGISMAQWTVWAATLIVPLLVLWAISSLVIAIAKRTVVAVRRPLIDALAKGIRWPAILLVSVGVHLAFLPQLSFTLQDRVVYVRLALVLAVVLVGLLLWRFMGLSFQYTRIKAYRKGHAGTASLMMLGERVLKVLLVLSSILVILALVGVNMTTALAGLGLGGVALALGAQKSVENLIGGIMLLTDRALAVGDFCRIAEHLGTVEDITLRSVRLRTLDQTLLNIPAGALSQSNIENFATRQKMLIQTMLRVRYDTTAAQLRSILEDIRALLTGNPELEQEGARIRVVNFGVQGIELELFAYVMTSDFNRFLTVRENLFLAAATIIESTGAGFVRPNEFAYANGAHPPAHVAAMLDDRAHPSTSPSR